MDPEGYSRLGDLSELRDVSRAVGSLNQILPKRQFILMGPGRWGSRGDVKLGVSVTYSDINNTAVLIEIARKKGNYVPDLSFGTHFFQDLVESGIRYLPLYPDDPGVVFNEPFFRKSENILARLLPDLAHLADTVRVIDVPDADGRPGAARAHERRPRGGGGRAGPAGRGDGHVGSRCRAPRRGRRRTTGAGGCAWRRRSPRTSIPARFGVQALLRLRQHEERLGRARAATSTSSSTSGARRSSAGSWSSGSRAGACAWRR